MSRRQRDDGRGGEEGVTEGTEGPALCGAEQVAPLQQPGQVRGLAVVHEAAHRAARLQDSEDSDARVW